MKNESSTLVLKTVVYKAAWNIKKAVYGYRMKTLKKAAIKQCAKPSFSLFSNKITASCSKELLHKTIKDLWNKEEVILRSRHRMEVWHIGNWRDLAVAESLLNLVKLSNTKYIRLTASDADVLAPYM